MSSIPARTLKKLGLEPERRRALHRLAALCETSAERLLGEFAEQPHSVEADQQSPAGSQATAYHFVRECSEDQSEWVELNQRLQVFLRRRMKVFDLETAKSGYPAFRAAIMRLAGSENRRP